ncbi:MAG: hypothetical protein KDC80_02675 [Saprospiraceae bacterium]|nr:hypothetical protein [Saprospiraceae bacterium]
MSKLEYTRKELRFAGSVAIAGALSMFAGAACWGASGTDLWSALANNQIDQHLHQVTAVKSLLVANTSFWILGVLLMGTAGNLMSGYCHSGRGIAKLATTVISAAVPMAIVAFITMLAPAIYTPSPDTAYLTGWIGTRLDDLATALIIGAFPLLISIAGRNDWVPGWLLIFGVIAGIAGGVAIIAMLTAIVPLGFIIIPVGLGWMIAAGIVLIRTKAI